MFVKRLSTPVLLDHTWHHQLSSLVSREALATADALAAAAHLATVSHESGIDYLCVIGTAKGAKHSELP
jgi:hypothetical protein